MSDEPKAEPVKKLLNWGYSEFTDTQGAVVSERGRDEMQATLAARPPTDLIDLGSWGDMVEAVRNASASAPEG